MLQPNDHRALSDHPGRALLQGPWSPAPAGTVEPSSSTLGCQAMLQPSDRRALLRSSLSSFAPGAVEPCSSRHCRALLRQALSSLAPVPLVVKPCSNHAIVEHCSDHPGRALVQGPSSLAPAGTIEPCSSALGCRALKLQPDDRRALLRLSLLSLAPGTVEPYSG